MELMYMPGFKKFQSQAIHKDRNKASHVNRTEFTNYNFKENSTVPKNDGKFSEREFCGKKV